MSVSISCLTWSWAVCNMSMSSDVRKVTCPCPKGQQLQHVVDVKKHYECQGPHGKTRTYHKSHFDGSEKVFPFMACACGFKVCVACAEIGEYETSNIAPATTLAQISGAIVADSLKESVQTQLQLPMIDPSGVFSSGLSIVNLIDANLRTIALWKTCCDWRSIYEQLAELDELKLRAYIVAAAAKNTIGGKQLALLIRGSLEERDGKLTLPNEVKFTGRMAQTAALLYRDSEKDRGKALSGLAVAAFLGPCTIM